MPDSTVELVLRAIATGKDRHVLRVDSSGQRSANDLSRLLPPQWSSDGRSVLVDQSYEEFHQALIDLSTLVGAGLDRCSIRLSRPRVGPDPLLFSIIAFRFPKY